MTSNTLKNVSARSATSTPQSKKAVKGQKKNDAGGYTFVISDMERVKRFLILGSEASFYSSAEKLSLDNAKTFIKMTADDESHRAVVDLVVQVSTEGRAPKQDPGLFALAILSTHGSDASRSYANSVLPQVARTASSLFSYVAYREQFGGRSMGFRKSVQRWYLDRSADSLAYQGVKYRQREGWTHRDLLRAVRPSSKGMEQTQKGVIDYLVHGRVSEDTPKVITGFEAAKKNFSTDLIAEYGLTWDMLPTDVLTRKDVWAALLDADNVPLGALIRQLSRLTNLGLLGDLEQKYTALVVSRLLDKERIEKSRIHPLTILTAQYTYAAGRSEKGSGTWTPVQKVVSALDKAFYMAFKNVTPTGKRFLLGLDVSGSMSAPFGQTHLTSRDAVTAMALVTAATEDYVHAIGFTGGYSGHGGGMNYWGRGGNSSTAAGAVKVLNINPSDSLATNVARTASLPFGSTDCALPMVYAMEQGLEVDVFVVYTDNDTWVGNVHPHEALQQYRKSSGIDAKLIVLSTQATRFSIADPNDAGMLDIPGWDSAAPQVISEFSRGL